MYIRASQNNGTASNLTHSRTHTWNKAIRNQCTYRARRPNIVNELFFLNVLLPLPLLIFCTPLFRHIVFHILFAATLYLPRWIGSFFSSLFLCVWNESTCKVTVQCVYLKFPMRFFLFLELLTNCAHTHSYIGYYNGDGDGDSDNDSNGPTQLLICIKTE